jgi:hypothetical protein
MDGSGYHIYSTAFAEQLVVGAWLTFHRSASASAVCQDQFTIHAAEHLASWPRVRVRVVRPCIGYIMEFTDTKYIIY